VHKRECTLEKFANLSNNKIIMHALEIVPKRGALHKKGKWSTPTIASGPSPQVHPPRCSDNRNKTKKEHAMYHV
jgi:hypothetical protein